MIKRFCLAPLVHFRANICSESEFSSRLAILPARGVPAQLVREYEASVNDSGYAALSTPHRVLLEKCEVMLQYRDELPDSEYGSWSNADAKKALDLGLLAMHLVRPTMADQDIILIGFEKAGRKEVVEVRDTYVPRIGLTEEQRAGIFNAGHTSDVRWIYLKLEHLLGPRGGPKSRFVAALQMYRSAIRSPYAEARIALYTDALEALFDTRGPGSVRIWRDRISGWLGTFPEERDALKSQVDTLFSIRSPLLQGVDPASVTREASGWRASSLWDVVEAGDNLVRRSLAKLMVGGYTLDFLTTSDRLKSFWDAYCAT